MSEVEFYVYDARSEGGLRLVAGVVNKGSIPVGLVFKSVRSGISEVKPEALAVAKTITYRREVAELPEGMSGELQLLGEGIDSLQKRDMLVG
jgi:hypothetical protein